MGPKLVSGQYLRRSGTHVLECEPLMSSCEHMSDSMIFNRPCEATLPVKRIEHDIKTA